MNDVAPFVLAVAAGLAVGLVLVAIAVLVVAATAPPPLDPGDPGDPDGGAGYLERVTADRALSPEDQTLIQGLLDRGRGETS